MTDIDHVKGNFSVYNSGEYVVLTGSKLCIFRPDGDPSLFSRRFRL